AKEDEPELFTAYYESDVADELGILQQEFDFTLYKTGGRIYLIPNQTNDLFAQNNADLKRSVGSDAKLDDIYMFNYLAVFILFSLYGGSGANLRTREFFKVSDMIAEFTDHCQHIRSEAEDFAGASEKYSIDFIRLADKWLSKRSEKEKSVNTMYGTIMRIIRKFCEEELLIGKEPDTYEPTRKLNDLMPYFLSQKRIEEVNSIFKGSDE
ncbi:MAG: DUF6063 family protein, partial [Porcipelethomonas sp.]